MTNEIQRLPDRADALSAALKFRVPPLLRHPSFVVRHFHLLGLDAPLVAVGWQCWWARWTHASLGWPEQAVLFLAVWLIYLADRVADGAALAPAAVAHASARHRFALRQRRPLLMLLAGLVALLTPLAWFGLNAREFRAGLALLAVQASYFVCIHLRQRVASPRSAFSWLKEAWVGLSFAAGSALFAVGGIGRPDAGILWTVGLFALLCFLNCALISKWEMPPADLAKNKAALLRPACGCLACVALACGAIFDPITLPLATGAAGLWTLDAHLARRWLSLETRRVLADVALLAPWLFLVLFTR